MDQDIYEALADARTGEDMLYARVKQLEAKIQELELALDAKDRLHADLCQEFDYYVGIT